MGKKISPILMIMIVIAAVWAISQSGFLGAVGPMGTTITRSISPQTPAPGDTITVTLDVNPASGVKSILIQDISPFTINGLGSVIYETAIIDQLGISPTTKQYTITAGSVGTYNFRGEWSEEGVIVGSVDGVTSFTVSDCTPYCERPLNLCIIAEETSDRCGGTCAGYWTVDKDTKADSNCDGTVDWSEINSAISNWLSGTYNWNEINAMISAWLGG